MSVPYDGHCRVCGKEMDPIMSFEEYDADGYVVCSDECADVMVNGPGVLHLSQGHPTWLPTTDQAMEDFERRLVES